MLIIIKLQYCYNIIVICHAGLVFISYISIQEELTKYLH